MVTTVGSAQDAQKLAREILARHLGACVQIEPAVMSHYRWKGRLCEEPEVRLTIKTLPACEASLQELFETAHPYELPQFVGSLDRASAAYAQWVRSEVQTGAGP
ncbi:MAG: divalent-cation tolerance protein CutA [Ramlibacter sp.]